MSSPTQAVANCSGMVIIIIIIIRGHPNALHIQHLNIHHKSLPTLRLYLLCHKTLHLDLRRAHTRWWAPAVHPRCPDHLDLDPITNPHRATCSPASQPGIHAVKCLP